MMTSTDFHCAAARERRLAARRQERTGSDARGHDAGAEQLADDRDPRHVQLQHGVHVAEQRLSRHGRSAYNTGLEQPRDVEQCACPEGHKGTSCEVLTRIDSSFAQLVVLLSICRT